MSFNLLDYLSSRNIAFKAEGKNVGREDIAINCLFCDDPSFHLNIHRTIGMWRCLICGEKGGIFHLVKAIEPEGTRIKDVLADYFDYEVREKEEERKQYKIDLNDMSEVGTEKIRTNIFYPLFLEWIKERGFDEESIYFWGGLLSESYSGYFAYRLIVPIFDDYEEVCYVGRDMTGRANIKYLPVPNGVTKKTYQDCLYNVEEATTKGGLILVEGIFDVWRVFKTMELKNYAVVATLGKALSFDQIGLIKGLMNRKDLMEVVICLDGGSRKETKEYVSLISPYHRNITVVDLPDNEDPDSLGWKGQFEYYFYRRQRVV